MQSYSLVRKQREEFRKRLINLVMTKEDDLDLCIEDVRTLEDKEIYRYYYYIRHGVDTIHVAPLSQKTLDRVLELIPNKLKSWLEILVQLVEDMKDDFMIAIKKAIVDFVLKDPNLKEDTSDSKWSFERKECKAMTGTLMVQFKQHKTKLEKMLHITNPCLVAIIDLWYCNFKDLRIVDVKKLKQHKGAYELDEFEYTFDKSVDDCKNTIMNNYYKGVIDLFLAGNKKRKLPDPAFPKRLAKFYNSVAAIMTYQLQVLCLSSLEDYINYITDVKVSLYNLEYEMR